MNWRVKPIRPPRVLKGHDDHVITCLQFSGNRIVSGSDDNTLKVWSATTGKVRIVILLRSLRTFGLTKLRGKSLSFKVRLRISYKQLTYFAGNE